METIPMTADEILAEIHYRHDERLGVLCSDGLPSEVEKSLSRAAVDEWLGRFHAMQLSQLGEFGKTAEIYQHWHHKNARQKEMTVNEELIGG
jgi:hypothetical protein